MGKRKEPMIEVVVERTDTAEDKVKVFVDGKRITEGANEGGAPGLLVVLVDPGRGWTPAAWEDYRVRVETPDMSPACRTAVAAAFDRSSTSEFIEE